ncbi:hypothetical protein HGM15179_017545 [Zosterops borbonicus]|uniref:Uncharacterized protein n=1 Tax=Zosterops borbonicus TaxID=364589 RepID=A0A8K1G0N3_9PASS|nr:hypothetical protein HGM15179_017545 [Zosterops borbonicus]
MTFPKNLHGDAQRTELEMEIWKIWEADHSDHPPEVQHTLAHECYQVGPQGIFNGVESTWEASRSESTVQRMLRISSTGVRKTTLKCEERDFGMDKSYHSRLKAKSTDKLGIFSP